MNIKMHHWFYKVGFPVGNFGQKSGHVYKAYILQPGRKPKVTSLISVPDNEYVLFLAAKIYWQPTLLVTTIKKEEIEIWGEYHLE